MVAEGPLIGMSLGGPSDRLEQNLELRMSPPVCNSVAEAERIFKNNSQLYYPLERKLNSKLLEEVSSFVDSENSNTPYSDTQIRKYLLDRGYSEATRGDVILARKKLGIRLPTLRKGE